MNPTDAFPLRSFAFPLFLLLAGAASAQLQYPVRRVANGCGTVTTAFALSARVTALSVIATGDAHVLVAGENTVRRFAFNGTQTFAVATASGPTALAATSTGDTWVISRSGSTLQRITSTGTLGATYGAAIAGTDPVAVAAIGSGAGGIADAWIVTAATRQVRRVAFPGVLAWSQALTGTPVDVAVHATGDSWVATQGPAQVRRFAASGVPGATIGLTGVPVAVAVDAAGNAAVVTTAPDQLVSVAFTGTVRFTVTLPAAPGGVAIDPSGHPAVTFQSRGEVRRYSFASGALLCTAAIAHGPAVLDCNPGNGELLVAAEPPPQPVPQLTALSPGDALAGGPAFTLTVDGSGFVANSIVRWNGADLPTTYRSGTRLTASVASERLALPATVPVTVFNPAPGGGPSNVQSFRVGQARATVSYFGTGCAGSGGAVPLLSVTGVPRLGTSYRLDLTAARPQAPVVFFAGASRTTWLGLALPLALTELGAPGCSLLAAGDVPLGGVTSIAGTASVALPVPAASLLVGQRLFHQVAVVDRPANALDLVFSRAVEAAVGDL